mgnify:CR=1 FL=1
MKTMNEKALKDFIREQGAAEEVVNALDMEGVEKIISSCDTMDEALDKICEAYPELDKKELADAIELARKTVDDQLAASSDSASEEMVDLNEDDLEAVAGGSAGSWFKKNWPILVGAAAGVGIAAAGMKIYSARAAASAAKSSSAAASTRSSLASTESNVAVAGDGAAAGAGKAAGASGQFGTGAVMGLFALSTLPSLLQDL